MRCSQPRHRDTIGRATDIIEPVAMKKANPHRVAAVLTADANLEVTLDALALLGGHGDQLAHALHVKDRQR